MDSAPIHRVSRFLVPFVALLTACGSEVTNDGSGSGGAPSGGTGGSTSTDGTTSGVGGSVTTGDTTSATSDTSTTGAGGDAGFTACSETGTCALALKGCCAPCGVPTLSDFDPINEASLEAHRADVCPDPAAEVCSKCPMGFDPTLYAYCDLAEGVCKGTRITETPFTECTTASDCTLRLGLDCCECGSSGQWVAVANAKLAELSGTLCAPGESCPECQPEPPPELSAICNAGRCEAAMAGPQ